MDWVRFGDTIWKQEAVGSLYSCASKTCRKLVDNTHMMRDESENRCHVTLTWNDTGEKVNRKSVS